MKHLLDDDIHFSSLPEDMKGLVFHHFCKDSVTFVDLIHIHSTCRIEWVKWKSKDTIHFYVEKLRKIHSDALSVNPLIISHFVHLQIIETYRVSLLLLDIFSNPSHIKTWSVTKGYMNYIIESEQANLYDLLLPFFTDIEEENDQYVTMVTGRHIVTPLVLTALRNVCAYMVSIFHVRLLFMENTRYVSHFVDLFEKDRGEALSLNLFPVLIPVTSHSYTRSPLEPSLGFVWKTD